MIILHFDLQPQFKYMNCFIYTSHLINGVVVEEQIFCWFSSLQITGNWETKHFSVKLIYLLLQIIF